MMNSLRAVTIIYLVYFKYISQASIECTSLYGADVTIQRNVKFNESGENSKTVLTSFASISIGQCISECRSRSDCRAVEYRFLAKYCSLRSDVLEVVRAPGHLTVTGFEDTVSCGHVTCGAGEACDPQRGACVVKECGQPFFGSHVMGNRYGINDRLVYTHLNATEQWICEGNGDWMPVTDGLACGNIRKSNPQAKSGLYKNRLNMTIYCEVMDDGTDWLVFQRRMDGSVDFYRNWTEYKHGFGNLSGEFWFGLEKMYTILNESTSVFEMRVDLEDWDNGTSYAVYGTFGLGDEDDGYRLRCEGYSGNAKDGINGLAGQKLNGMKFTTSDKDNDLKEDNCAVVYHGAWWFRGCHYSHLNGKYYPQGPSGGNAIGILWGPPMGYSRKHASMKMREKQI